MDFELVGELTAVETIAVNLSIRERESLKERYGALEEGKADILGLYMIRQLNARGEMGRESIENNYVTFLASLFRSVRFGAADAHLTVTYYPPLGRSIVRTITVPGRSRHTVEVFGTGEGAGPGLSSLGIVVASPESTLRAAASASIASVLPRRCRVCGWGWLTSMTLIGATLRLIMSSISSRSLSTSAPLGPMTKPGRAVRRVIVTSSRVRSMSIRLTAANGGRRLSLASISFRSL